MTEHKKERGETVSIRDLYPTLSEEERSKAEGNLDRYVALALRVYERMRQDPAAYTQFQTLTKRTGDQ